MRRVAGLKVVFSVVCGLFLGTTVLWGSSDCAATITASLIEPVLENADMMAVNAVIDMVRSADTACDRAFLEIKTPRELRLYQQRVRKEWISSFGGFPARTPLNPRVVGRVQRDGYCVEKIIFESQPAHYVTALMFLPDNPAKFAAPFPGILISCGHSSNGKALPGYQRAAVQGALQGFAVLIYDPIDQGERFQMAGEKPPIGTRGHNITGVSAVLLGWNTARFRIWDGIRAIDYMQTREDVDAERLGIMGNSGGGTLSSYLMSMDKRIKAGAPSCYITSFTELCEQLGPQDAEQNFFGQLSFGLNHTAYLLLKAPMPVCVNCTHDDFFSFYGAQRTFSTASAVGTRMGWGERFAMIDVPGKHGWQEGTRAGSVQWMQRWLKGDQTALPLDVAKLRVVSAEFDNKKADCGLAEKEAWVTESGQVRDLPGARSVYDMMRDELQTIEQKRANLTLSKMKQVVCKVTGIRTLKQIPQRRVLREIKQHQGFTETREYLDLFDNINIPLVTFAPEKPEGAPVLVINSGGKTNTTAVVAKYLAAGHVVMAADITCTGENGNNKRKFYGAPNSDEGVAVMLYLLGRSLVAMRAEDIMACASLLFRRYDNQPIILSADSGLSVAAYHAYAVEPQLFASIKCQDKLPLSWAEVVRQSDRYSFSNCVQGGLRFYDWINLYQPKAACCRN